MVSAAKALPHDVSVDFAATGVVRGALLRPTDEPVCTCVATSWGRRRWTCSRTCSRGPRTTTRSPEVAWYDENDVSQSLAEHHHRSRGRLLLRLHDRRGRRRRCDGDADVLSATTRSRGTRTTAPNHPRSAPLRRWLTAPPTPLDAWRSCPPGKTLRGVYEGRAGRPSPLGSGEPPGRPKHPLRAQACQRLC